jgi:hypothetical protein
MGVQFYFGRAADRADDAALFMLRHPDEDHPHTDLSNVWAPFETGSGSAGYVDARPTPLSTIAVLNAEAAAPAR